MALRPNNHITGDSAIRKIASDLIPEEWTISLPDSDYGLDMLIEVVRDNKTTGKLFFIQSKGTEDSSNGGIITFSINLERVKDYSEISLPVLFVYYSKTESKFWGRWMNSLYDTLTEKQKRQGTITLHFSPGNVIDANYLQSIGDDILPSITNRVSIVCDSNTPEHFSRFHTQVITTAKKLIGLDIAHDDHLSCKTIQLSYKGTLQDGYVEVRSDSVSVSIPFRLTSTEILYYPSIARNECPSCFLEIIYAIAVFGSSVSSQSFDYALEHPQKETLDRIPENVWLQFLNRICGEEVLKVQELFDLAIQTKHDFLAQSIILVAFAQVTKGHGLVVIYRSLLSRYLESEQDVSTKGLLCYNLANSIRRIDYHEALSLYFQATRFAPFYRKMSYWWEEVGGVLYLTGHYFFAERFYKKARKISQNECREDIGILIADCQICQGKIKEALLEESVYCESHKSISSSCHLKILITKIMDERCIQVFDPKYWFNLGVSRSSKGNFKESMNCFLIAWRLCDSDVEALINSFVESYNCGDNSMAALILPVIKNLFPERGYKMIVSTLLSNSNGNPNVGAFIDALKLYFFSEE